MVAALSELLIVDWNLKLLRALVSCMCCVACLGPLLIVVGVIDMVEPDQRADNIAKYNSAVTTFAHQIPTLTSTQGYVVSSPMVRMSSASSTISIAADQSGVNAGTTVTVQSATSVYMSGVASPSVYLSVGNATGNVVTIGPMPALSQDGVGVFEMSNCSMNHSAFCAQQYPCGYAITASNAMLLFQPSPHRNPSTPSPPSRPSPPYIGCSINCYYKKYLTVLCYPMSLSTTSASPQWIPSSLYGGCFYNGTESEVSFTSSQYVTCAVPDFVTLSFMSDLDPSFQLATLTFGTGNFGADQQKRTAGMHMLVTGLVFAAVSIVFFCIGRCLVQNDKNRHHVLAAFGRAPPEYYQAQFQMQPMMSVPMHHGGAYQVPLQPNYQQPPPCSVVNVPPYASLPSQPQFYNAPPYATAPPPVWQGRGRGQGAPYHQRGRARSTSGLGLDSPNPVLEGALGILGVLGGVD